MKKLLVLVALFTTVYVTKTNAQQTNSEPTKLERFKELVKPGLVEKVKLTEAQADKVAAIHYSYSNRMREVSKIPNEQQRQSQVEAINKAEIKEYKAIPLTEAQIKSVGDYFAEQGKRFKPNNTAPAQGN